MDARRYDLGVLFVHGIGNQPRGSTLADFGTPLIDCIAGRAKAAGATAIVRTASLVRDDGEPARAEMEINTNIRSARWLLAESWWAQSFPSARFSDVAWWAFVIVPWAIGSHFAKRLSRVVARKERRIPCILSVAGALVTLVGGLLLSPLLLLMLAMTLLLGRIPIPQLQSALSQLRSPIASSLGDSYLLVTRPIEAAAIQARILADLTWLVQRCEKVSVIAHSQGAALAARVISDMPGYKGLLITFGSGLRKLEELESVREKAWVTRGAGFTVAAIVVAALAVALSPALVFETLEDRSAAHAADVIYFAILAFAVVIAALGLKDFLSSAESRNLDAIIRKLTRPGIKWTDLYASADPVPNGELRDGEASPPHPIEVTNLGSVWRDHTSYWANHDEFVGRVAEELLVLDGQVLSQDGVPRALIASRRRRRIAALRAIGWTSIVSCAAILIRHWSDWMQVAAWTGKRALVWLAGLIGFSLKPAVVPDIHTWRQSVGWLLLVLIARWISRFAWSRWNTRAMRDTSNTPYPLALAIVFWPQFGLAVYLVAPSLSPEWISGLSLCGFVAMTFAASPEGRPQKPAPGTETTTSRPERALVNTGKFIIAVVWIIGLVWFYLIVVPRYLVGHPWARWATGIVIVPVAIALIRARWIRPQTAAAKNRDARSAGAGS